ncbi:MAG: SDR family oxidoreductase [Alphaproteobacteria bacterium]|nr:MAG: SDR family oxidoreductase [Alphaproteobacteria bacterium]
MRALVTGVAGALGQNVARHLDQKGWEVIGVDLAETTTAPVEHYFGKADLTNLADAERIISTLKDENIVLHGLVNIAGGFVWELTTEGTTDTWDRMWALNLKTALNMSKAALQILARPGGAIVNISAAASENAAAGMGAYAASKAAVSRLTENMAAELKSGGIRVNAIQPSIIDTPANRRDMPEAHFADWVTTEELAEAVAFLLSDAASGITGVRLPVTGRV